MTWGPYGIYRDEYVPRLLRMKRGERAYFRPRRADLSKLQCLISARAINVWGRGAVITRQRSKTVEVYRT